MAKRTFEIGCVTGEGWTKTEARENAISAAREALSADYRPIIVTFRDVLHVIVRTPTSWDAYTGGRGVTVWGPHMTRAELEAAARLHVAQIAWDGVEEESPLLQSHPEVQADFRRWARWQMGVKHYRAALVARGLTPNAAERIACDIVDGWERPEAHALTPYAA